MEIVIVWLGCAVGVGFYASSKGHSGFGMFLLSVVLSPLIGLIIELIRSPDRGTVEAKAVQSGDMRKCPSCAELVKAEAIMCRYCGEALAATADNSNAELESLLAARRASEQKPPSGFVG